MIDTAYLTTAELRGRLDDEEYQLRLLFEQRKRDAGDRVLLKVTAREINACRLKIKILRDAIVKRPDLAPTSPIVGTFEDGA